MKFKCLSDRVEALDPVATDEEEERLKKLSQACLMSFVMDNMTISEHREYSEWIQARCKNPEAPDFQTWPPCFLEAEKRARSDPVIDPELYQEKFFRADELRSWPPRGKPALEEFEKQGGELHVLNGWFENLSLWHPGSIEKGGEIYDNFLQRWTKNLCSIGVSEAKIKELTES